VQWVTTDAGRMLPFAAGAVPVREDLHPRLQVLFQVFDAATAFHSTVCRKRVVDSKSPRPPQ
jgi:hypothetical protein